MATTGQIAEQIAVIGMAARLPKSDTIADYWENLVAGRDCLTELTDDDLLAQQESPATFNDPAYVRRRPLISDPDGLDIAVFGMTPREAEVRDPQFRLMLETVHATLEHAGYDPGTYPGQIGMFAATNANRYRYDYVESHEDVVREVGWGAIDVANHLDYMCTFVSYKLGLRGPSATVLSACSSSLMAVHLACNAIRAGDCEMAVAGGVDVEFPYHRGYIPIPGSITSMDGVVRAFDAKTTGTNFGNGVGAVLLKPLSAAQRDGDTIHAVILGSALNNDGSRKVGFSAPSVSGQSECILRALTTSGVQPREIGYVETHGTGTRVGDPIEVAGLIDAFRTANDGDLPNQYCGIGSVKSNIGHLGQAAGISSLIKAILILRHDLIPASINVTNPNPAVDWENSPFYLNTEPRPWPAEPDRPRRIAVSSFGVGGTNAHVIIGDPPAQERRAETRTHEVLLWSAMDRTAESALRERLADHFDGLPDDRFGDAAYTLRVGRSVKPVRAALVATDAADAAAGLRSVGRVTVGDGVARRTVFAFPGQGAQFPGMCRDLYDTEPMFRGGCDAAFEILAPLLGHDVAEVWRTATDPADLGRTEVAQPLLYVLEYTLAHCLMRWGVTPSALIGHSLGELVAAAVAGVFDFGSGLRAVAGRARAMAEMPTGTMLAVAADPGSVAGLLTDDLVLAAVNGPGQTVLAGPDDAVADAAAALTGRGIATRTLVTSHAYHSPSMARAAQRFEAALGELRLNPPTIPVISAATGAVLDERDAVSPAFWANQLVTPVRFDAAATTLFADGPRTVVEVGPGRTVSSLLRGRSDLRSTDGRVVATVGRDTESGRLAQALAKLWVDGVPVTYWNDDDGRGYRRVAVPGYPYQRRSYWLEPLPRSGGRAAIAPAEGTRTTGGTASTASTASIEGTENTESTEGTGAPNARPVNGTAEVGDPGTTADTSGRRWRTAEVAWVRDTSVTAVDTEPGTGVVLLPADRDRARIMRGLLQRAGLRGARVVDVRTGAVQRRTGIDPTDPAAWTAHLDRADGTGPVTVVHAALPTPPTDSDAPAEGLLDTLTGVVAALRAAAAFRRRTRRPTRLLVVGSRLVDVTGGEPVDPVGAAVVALLRSAAHEHPDIRCGVVDVGTRPAVDAVTAALARDDLPVQAVRGASRWLPHLLPVADGPARVAQRIRHRGTYLITGGLGGLGLVVARALAESGLNPTLALLGRTPVAARADADEVNRALAELAEAGAQVEVVTGDVTDPASLRAVVDAVQERWGPVSGVVHSAGVPGGGLLERRTAEEMRAVLRPKIDGLHALETVFADRAPLDFLVVFSSVAAVGGMYGSGDYAAANAYLDAWCATRAGGHRLTMSVQWPGWAEVGMLARSPAGQALLTGTGSGADVTAQAPPRSTSNGAAANGASRNDAPLPGAEVVLERVREVGGDWEFDEHVFEGTPVIPGTGLLQIVALAGREVVDGADWPVEIRDLVFLAPLVGDRRRRIRALARPLRRGHKVIVQSRGDGTDEAWSDHATATVVAATVPDPPTLTLPDQGPMSEETDATLAGWVAFGPRWETMTDVRGHDAERFARLVLDERYHGDFAEHPVHPAIVDVAAGVLTDLVPGRPYAPFIYRRVTVLASLTGDVWVHARFSDQSRTERRAVDFDVYDTATGKLLMRVESFAMREVLGQAFGAAAQVDAPAPREHTSRAPTIDREIPVDQLLPGEGAAAFLRLLRGDQPPVVMVDLPGAGLRIPGMPWADAPPAPPVVAPAAPGPGSTATRTAAVGVTSTKDAEPAAAATAAPTADAGDVLTALQELWTAALGTPDIGPDDDFFAVGGNSLAAVQLTARMNAHFGTDLGAGTLFDYPTLRLLATEVHALRDADPR